MQESGCVLASCSPVAAGPWQPSPRRACSRSRAIPAAGIRARRRIRAREEIHRDAIVIDGHNDVAIWILDSGFDLGMDGADPRKKSVEPWMLLMRFLTPPPGAELRTHTDLHRLERGGVDAQFFSIWADPRGRGPGEYRTRAIEMIEALLGQFARHAGRLTLAVSAHDIREAAAAGKIAGLMGLEGGHAIEDDLANVENFYDLGVRYMTLHLEQHERLGRLLGRRAGATAGSPTSAARSSAR